MQIGDFSSDDLLIMAKLSNIAYMTDPKAAVEQLGLTFVAEVGSAECQATIATWGGFAVVAIRGTQVGGGNLSIPELYDDIDNDVMKIPHFGRVHKGFFLPLKEIWHLISANMPLLQPLIVGHSLGGVRAHLAKYYSPSAEVISFGAPKGADDAFWTECYTEPPIRVVYENDFAPGWPWDGPWTQPADVAWLHSGKLDMVTKRPGWCVSAQDHSIDAYIVALSKL
jgi:hypothetical protein